MTEICVLTKDSFEIVKEKLKNSDFQHVESYNNHDIYFTTISQDLKTNDYSQLIEKSILIRGVKGVDFEKKYIIYKKKSFDKNGNVIDEVKTKLQIDDIEKAKTIFQNLGLVCWCDYVVNNNEFKKDEIVVNVQDVDALGTFVEIEEYESIKNKSDEEKFNILKDAISSMDIQIFSDYSCKKPFMMLNHFENK